MRGNPLKYALFIGEMLIDFIPNTTDANGTSSYQPHPGGAVANAAVALARLGGAARFLGKLGEDGFGRLLLRVLQENQVDITSVPTTSRGPTTLVLVTLQDDGQREFTFYRQQTADTLLEIGELAERTWTDVTLCHAGSVLLTSEPARSTTLAAMEQARQSGLLVSFDVNVRPALWSSEEELRTTLARVIPSVDLLKFSVEEAHYLASTLTEALNPADDQALQMLADELLARGPSLVVITRGPRGASLFTRQHAVETAASTLQAIDTTGAGDAFMGALLHRLLERDEVRAQQLAALSAHDLQELGTFANTAAGISCTRYGGIASLPSLEEVEAALER
jgi:fructokinase